MTEPVSEKNPCLDPTDFQERKTVVPPIQAKGHISVAVVQAGTKKPITLRCPACGTEQRFSVFKCQLSDRRECEGCGAMLFWSEHE